MKKMILLLLWLIGPMLNAQPVITNAEHFTIGTVLKFKTCSSAGISEGNGGANQTWDFSSLVASTDTLVKTMKLPSATSSGSLFPSATIAEDCTDGTLVYVSETSSGNFIVGFIDRTYSPALTIKYPNPMRTSDSPITFGTLITDSFSTIFSNSGYNFRGLGSSTLTGDGYGTLMLPSGTYTNVLRVKLIQYEVDSLLQMGTTYDFTSITWMFFDQTHASALLTINSVTTTGTQIKNVNYLIDETTPTGTLQHNGEGSLKCYPNPAHNYITIESKLQGIMQITNVMGEPLKTIQVIEQQNIGLEDLLPGTYFIELKTATGYYRNKLLIH